MHCNYIEVTTPKLDLKDIERSITKTYKSVLFTPFLKAITEYNLVEPNDKIAVAISGGKDSLLLAKLFQELKRHNKFPFEVVFLSMDPGFIELNRNQLLSNCEHLNIPLSVEESHIFDVVGKIAKENPCYLCAKMRRGFLYQKAKELGCNKLALGHHMDDVIETTLLNVFYAGQFGTMVPKIKAENFDDIELIRPLFYVEEKDIIRWVKYSGIQAMNCGCTVAALKTSSKRREMKELVEKMKAFNPDVAKSIFKSAENVNLEAILGYKNKNKKTHFNEIYDKKGKLDE
ncbi:PP-loop family protein [Alteracholeplasma palmae J233]|uniref:PP-loop family protein n=1 Tax=Alteracholeplasma palmae (strain ATCC 49389 / J233) TaxID=1318466 RepID=U4KLZ0_ALTPJ|nr:ATP-binding protein [Alteracholeplasma palmae]CCV64992.1 PP-loop family protein [Alteracholeplasma palmae J233]